MGLNESHVEEAAQTWLADLGYEIGHGPHLAPGEPASERDSFSDVVLKERLSAAIARLNPEIPAGAREDALRQVLLIDSASLVQNNARFHRFLRDGVDVQYQRADGSTKTDKARLIDFTNAASNDCFAVNQFTVIEAHHNRRPDIVVFINGLPLAILELKNAADENATIWSAYNQLQTYKAEIPSLMHYNELLVLSDGLEARIGSLTANQEWFKVWRTISGEGDAAKHLTELEVMVRGVFDKARLLALLEHFVVFEENPDTGVLHKIIAGYHQFHAVNAAVDQTLRASGMTADAMVREEPPGYFWSGEMRTGKPGDRRAGVVWHTQGSGKSLSMLFYAARMARHEGMKNPTLVVLTDRNDLDDQLFGQFQRCHELLGQMPVQADSREKLRELLSVASGGVVFTTVQKFIPETKGSRFETLSDRRNIVVIADEAHRSQYEFGSHLVKAKDGTSYIAHGLAANMRAMRCRMRRSLDLPARRSSGTMPTRERYSATTSASTTFSARWPTRRPCRSTTRAGSRSWVSMPPSCRRWIRNSTRSPKAKNRPIARS